MDIIQLNTVMVYMKILISKLIEHVNGKHSVLMRNNLESLTLITMTVIMTMICVKIFYPKTLTWLTVMVPSYDD